MKKKFKINRKKGIVFWITGLSGSGKSTIAGMLHRDISNIYGPTVLLNGDKLRNIFKLKGYSKKERLRFGVSYSKICKLISNNKINVIIATVGLFHKLHKYNRQNLDNYLEIFIKSRIKKLLKNKQKTFYRKKTNNVWGMDLVPEFPKNPHIKVNNDFKKSEKHIKEFIYKKIIEILGT